MSLIKITFHIMCFSAGASFGASAVLGAIGIVTIAKAKNVPQRLFASIPVFFAVQQLAEGMIWLSLADSRLNQAQDFFVYTFLVFAMMVWPVWIPLTVRSLEKDLRRRKIMNWLLGIGLFVFLGIGAILLSYPAAVVPSHHHLHYDFGFPPTIKKMIWFFDLLYILATIVTPFISTVRRMKWLGVIFLVSYIVAFTFFKGFVLSVWCFLAAGLSIVVLWIITGLRRTE